MKYLILLTLLVSSCSNELKREPYRTALFGNLGKVLDPVGLTEINEETLLSQICARLVQIDQSENIVSDVANSWELSANKKDLIFKLATDRQFVDGTSLKVEDVIFSIKRIVNIQDSLIESWTGDIDSIHKLSESELKISLKKINPRFIFQLAHPRFCILSEKNPFIKIDELSVPNSSGSYKVTKFERNTFSLELNTGSRKSVVEKRIEVILANQDDALSLFLSGRLNDLSFYILDKKELDMIKEKAQLIKTKLYWTWVLGFNPDSFIFKKNKNRALVSNSFNKDNFLKTWGAETEASDSLIPKGYDGYSGHISQKIKLVTNKLKCTKPITISYIKGMPEEQNLVSALRNELNKATNCLLQFNSLEMGEWLLDKKLKKADIYVYGIDNNAIDPVGFYRGFIDSNSDCLLSYNDPTLKAAYNDISNISVRDRTKSDYEKLYRAFIKTNYAITLGHPIVTFAYSKDVSKIHMNPLGMHLNQWSSIGR